MTSVVAVYHRDCPDGTTAAACLLAKYPEAQVFPLAHSHTPADLEVILAQVTNETNAFTLDCILGARELATRAKSLTIIDHHAGVEKEMRDFAQGNKNVTCIFDNEHSGASLAWSYCNPNTETPELIRLVEDVDLWKWIYGERSRFASTFLMTLQNEPHRVVELLNTNIETLVARGRDMALYEDALTQRFLEKAEPVWVFVGDSKVPLYNNPHFDSFIGNSMSEKHGCTSGVFDIRGTQVRLSFRSKDGQNPSAFNLATILGGGGHRNAAGATMTREQFLKMLAQ